MPPKFLLLQARNTADPTREEEHASFAQKMGLPRDQIETFDLLQRAPDRATLDSYDGLLMGGSGDYYVSKMNLPHFDGLLAFLREVVDRGFPFFASCFGFQCVVAALGGKVAFAPDHTEVGSYEIQLTDAGREDELLGDLPERFWAQLGRKDRAETLPESVVALASSERCAYQSIRIPQKPIWGFQFHPELDREENRRRFLRYMDGYAQHMGEEERRRQLDLFRESPEAESLLGRFVGIVFG